MQYAHLGRTGLKVGRLALGTMNFGDATDEPTSFQIMDAALDAGINLIDTADVYGVPQTPDMAQGYGLSEEIIGRWLAQGSGRRERIVLATKLYQPMGLGPNDKYLSAYKIRKAAEASLRRLRTETARRRGRARPCRGGRGRPRCARWPRPCRRTGPSRGRSGARRGRGAKTSA